MPLSPAGFPKDLDPSNPIGQDPGSILDAQCRNIIQSIKQTFPQMGEATQLTGTEIDRAKSGFGGIQLSGPTDIIPSVTLTTSRVLAGPYDKNIDPAPVDVVQDFSTSSITIQPGRWLITGSLSGRMDPASVGTIMRLQLVGTIGKVGQSMQSTTNIAAADVGFGISFCGFYATTVAIQLELGFQLLTPTTLTINFADYAELSASRIGLNV